MVTRSFLQKTVKPHAHFTLPTAFVHHPPGYSSLMKRGRERPSCIVWAGFSGRLNACDSTTKGHCFYHLGHFYHHALVKGSQVDFTCPMYSLLLFISFSSLWISYSMTLKKDLIPIFLVPGLSNRWHRISLDGFLSLHQTKQRASPMLSSHFLVIPNSSVCQRVSFVLQVPKVLRIRLILIYLKSIGNYS